MIYGLTSKELTSKGAGCRRVQASRFLRRYIRKRNQSRWILFRLMTWPEQCSYQQQALRLKGRNPMKKTLALVLTLCLLMMTAAFSVAETAAEEQLTDVSSAVISIATAEDLAAINSNLSGSYVLTADIDLDGAEWTPIGSFVQLGSEGEEAETPDPAYAFTGTFDGQGHTISNFVITRPEGWAVGLFGVISNTQIGNFNIMNAKVTGTTMVSSVVGYSHCSMIYNVNAENVTVIGNATEISEEGMYGGIVGAGMAGMIKGCSARADIIVPDNSGNGGIIGGGLEMTDVIDCTASGSVIAGNDCYGIGGISGCGFSSNEFTGNTAENVKLAVGDNCFWIGGITGYSGGFEDESLGLPVTAFSGCKVVNTEISAGENADGIGVIVGAGFFREGLAEEYGIEDYANPTVFTLSDCEAANVTLNGTEMK